MIEAFYIISKGGLCVWSYINTLGKEYPINQLITNVLLQEKAEPSYEYDNYTLRWTFANHLDLIFIVVSLKYLNITYGEELLNLTKQKFVELIEKEKIDEKKMEIYDFDDKFKPDFKNFLRACEERVETAKELNKLGLDKDIIKEVLLEKPKEDVKIATKKDDGKKPTVEDEKEKKKLEVQLKVAEMKKKKEEELKKKTSKKNIKKEDYVPVVKGKEMTKWDDSTFTEEKSKVLNQNEKEKEKSEQVTEKEIEEYKKKFMNLEKPESRMEEEENYEDFDSSEYQVKEKKSNKGFFSFFTNLTGTVLDEENLEPILSHFQSELKGKNVASSVSEKICKSIEQSLVGKNTGTFSTIKGIVYNAMEETLTKILTPNRNVDVLRDIKQCQEQNKIYSVVFCGVNGVGKSTSLSKICYWLLQNNIKVLIAACDTFRSAAVEQLKVHGACLKVEIFERGYGKDAASVASEAINYAKKKGYDVVLIDTAGRMEDNEELMGALHKLITVNKPNLVLFVGEALVGNKGVEQLTKFNQSLTIISQKENTAPRGIDGILLTKYDTIDDKVGASLSMVYSTGIPILFIGVGQTYPDLKKLSVKSVVKSLLN